MMSKASETATATPDGPFRADPQLAEIKRLERELDNTKALVAGRDSWIESYKKEREELKKQYAEAWGLNFLKAILRVVVILLWFALTVGCLATPWWALYQHLPMAVYYLWALLPGLILGILFWLYIHEKT